MLGGRRMFCKLMPSAEVARTLYEQATVAMVMIDGSGQVHHLNAAAERLFGYSKSDLVGQSMEIFFRDSSVQAQAVASRLFQFAGLAADG